MKTISPTLAKGYVRHLASAATILAHERSPLHPDETKMERAYIRNIERALFAIIDGRLKVQKRRA